jgi:ABC-type multidrug transport system fused ATPase/permease subunit
VPQDATLFQGTLRSNLDPFGEHPDAELLAILSRVGLSHWTLDDELDASGAGTSAGERQLVALGRAFLRRSAVVVLDESTASVDIDMDRRLQTVIREELAEALVLTIAHRLETVIGVCALISGYNPAVLRPQTDYDRIIVMSRGEVVEQGTPAELLRRSESAFFALCRKSGKLEELRGIAEAAEKRA